MTEPGLTPEPAGGSVAIDTRAPQGFDEFYRDTHALLHRKAARLSQGHQQEAEDLVAETYLRAWRKWDTVHNLSESHRVGWTIVTLTNVVREYWRAQSRQPALESPADAQSTDDLPDCSACVPEAAAARIAYAVVLQACGRVLKGSLYEVFMMRLLGFDYAEIASMRESTSGAVRAQAAQALKTLRVDAEVADILAQLREGGA